MSTTDLNITHPIIDATDALTCAQAILSYVLSNRTREHDAGEGWCLGTVELKILEAIEALNAARLEASHQPS